MTDRIKNSKFELNLNIEKGKSNRLPTNTTSRQILDKVGKQKIDERIDLKVEDEELEYYKIRKEKLDEIDKEIASYNGLLEELDGLLKEKDTKKLIKMSDNLNIKSKNEVEEVDGEAVTVVDDISNVKVSEEGKIINEEGKELTKEEEEKLKKELQNKIKSYEEETIKAAIEELEKEKTLIPYEIIMEEDGYKNYKVEEVLSEEEVKKIMDGSTNEESYQTSYNTYIKYCEEQEIEPMSDIEWLRNLFKYYSPDENQIGIKVLSTTGIGDENCELLQKILEIEEEYPEYGKMYEYIYKTEGRKKAQEYLEVVSDEVTKATGEIRAAEFLNGLENTNNVDEYFKVAGKGFCDGVESFYEGLGNTIYSTDKRTVEEYERMYIGMALQSQTNKEKQGLVDINGESKSGIIDYGKDYAKISDEIYK